VSDQIAVKPQGLITEPNKVGQFPPGAFSYAINGAIRSFGVLEPVRKFELANTDFLNGNLVGGIYALSEGPYTIFLVEHTALGTWQLCVTCSTSFSGYITLKRDIPAPWNSYITNDARTGIVFARNRVIITGAVRSFAFDVFEDADGIMNGLEGPRNCGVYQTILYDRNAFSGLADDPAYLGPNQHFSATSVLRMVHRDGYELVSPPAVPYDYANLSTTLPQVHSQWITKADLTLSSGYYSHHLDIYRTRAQSVGYDSVSNKYLPISTGSSFYLSKTVRWAANWATYFNLSSDTTLPATLGEALLTNVSVGGASALPLPPTPAKTCATFRGHAFYANRWDPATFTLLNPYYWGFMPFATAGYYVLTQGIGIRYTTTGQTATSGSPTVTGLPNTYGVVVGQTFNVYRVDSGLLVTPNNTVVSVGATTITGAVNSSYSGNVRVDVLDRIELNGLNVSATESPQSFVSQLFFGNTSNLNTQLDVAAVGLEPITTENPAGVYPNFVPTGGLVIRMRTNSPITLRATNGQNFSPYLPELNATAHTEEGSQQKNGFAWSENNEPENCPPSNYAFCGQGEIYKIIATRDCLWFFCSDGLFRLSGAGGSVGEEYDWVIDPVDPSLIITNPDCAVVFRDSVYALTNRGVVAISSEGTVRQLSDGRINPTGWPDSDAQFMLPNKSWSSDISPNGISTTWPWMAVDNANEEIWIRYRHNSGTVFGKIWVYNVKTDTWMVRVPSYHPGEVPSLATYNQSLQRMFMLYAGRRDLIADQIANFGAYEGLTARFQPFYGVNGSYSLKHWRDINLSFSAPWQETNYTCELRSQAISAGTRVIPTSSPTGNQMEMSRVGFTIPRAWPAMANSIAPELVISGSPDATTLQPPKLEGFSISYEDVTPQRIKR